jgi:hypothetical protein
MKAIELAAIYERPRMSLQAGGTQEYPYLVASREVASPDEGVARGRDLHPDTYVRHGKRDDRAG